MGRLLIVRHAETQWNAIKRIQGQTNIPLSRVGHEQAETVADRLASRSVAAVYTSPLLRAMVTAKAIAKRHYLPVMPVQDLREFAYGDWEGLTATEVASKYPSVWEQRRQNKYVQIPGGESSAVVGARMLQCISHISMSHFDETVVIVSHGGSLRAFFNENPSLKNQQIPLDNASVTEIIGQMQQGHVTFTLAMD